MHNLECDVVGLCKQNCYKNCFQMRNGGLSTSASSNVTTSKIVSPASTSPSLVHHTLNFVTRESVPLWATAIAQ
jgi:hypothetical protein